MSKQCLYCYKEIDGLEQIDFHVKCSKKFFGTTTAPVLDYSLDQMAQLALNIVERSIAMPGVQPKLSMSLVKESPHDDPAGRLTVVGALGGNYIFKPPSDFFAEMPQNEHVTMRIAEAFGIPVVQSSLIKLKSGELAYITKRIDRTDAGNKIHMLDMFQILEAFDKYKGSMEKVGKALGEYSANILLDKLYYFEIAVFSFLTGNNDMHLKNFSMINRGSEWLLAPAYDLLNVAIANPEDTEELALTLEGKKKKLKREHFERLGKGLGLNTRQVEGVFNRFFKNKPLAIQWVKSSFLSAQLKQDYIILLEERYTRLL
jgi:serine/threonine-protein kinase HipA